MDMMMLIWGRLQVRYQIFARNNKLFNKLWELRIVMIRTSMVGVQGTCLALRTKNTLDKISRNIKKLEKI